VMVGWCLLSLDDVVVDGRVWVVEVVTIDAYPIDRMA